MDHHSHLLHRPLKLMNTHVSIKTLAGIVIAFNVLVIIFSFAFIGSVVLLVLLYILAFLAGVIHVIPIHITNFIYLIPTAVALFTIYLNIVYIRSTSIGRIKMSFFIASFIGCIYVAYSGIFFTFL